MSVFKILVLLPKTIKRIKLILPKECQLLNYCNVFIIRIWIMEALYLAAYRSVLSSSSPWTSSVSSTLLMLRNSFLFNYVALYIWPDITIRLYDKIKYTIQMVSCWIIWKCLQEIPSGNTLRKHLRVTRAEYHHSKELTHTTVWCLPSRCHWQNTNCIRIYSINI